MRQLTVFVTALILLLQSGMAESADQFDLSAQEGKIVIVDFWASWCVPCRRSFPWLNAMHDKYADKGLVIVGVNLDQERSEAEVFLQEYPPRFQIHYDESKEMAKKFGVVAMPSTYLLGSDGEIRKRHYGFKVKKQDEYEAAIVEALNSLE